MTSEPLKIPVLPIGQPIGEFYIGVINSNDLKRISYADIRDMENDLDTYLGIQRRLSPTRVKDLKKYVTTLDATFPTSIVLAIEGECAEYDEKNKQLILRESKNISYEKIAKILDGQHRIEGLKDYYEDDFDLNVTIFINADIADQANIFATVNLAQTKVNKSLVYDLYDYAESRSPQKTAHDVAVSLDLHKKSPLLKMIKRLGFATEGREGETLTQAAVVEALLYYFISSDPKTDRDLLLRGKKLAKADQEELKRYPFRNLFINNKDVVITKILLAYFRSIKKKWPNAWVSRERGNILPRTNGFRALMRFLRLAYVHLTTEDNIGSEVPEEKFYSLFQKIDLNDEDFNIDNYPPGTSGESKLLKKLKEDTRL